MKQKNKDLINRIWIIAFGSIALFYFLQNLYLLTTGSYVVAASDLVRIDSLALQGNAYHLNKKGIEITTADGFKLNLRSENYYNVDNRRALLDTLMYDGTVFSIYTDKEGYEDYRAGRTDNSIGIYRFIIGTREYTQLGIRNEHKRSNLFMDLFITAIFAVVFLYQGLKKQR